MILQLIDQSATILYDIERTEKVMQSMVNATVSHEIRNPINAIHCQHNLLKKLTGRLNDLAQTITRPDFSLERFLVRLTRFGRQFDDCLRINIASEKLITMLVEDFLDLNMIKSDRFRRIDKNFTVKKPFEEVISILSYKAEQKRI